MSRAILALDLAQRTGFARTNERGELVDSGILDFAIGEAEHPGEHLRRVSAELSKLVIVEGSVVARLAWERVIDAGTFGSNARSLLFVLQSRAVEVAFLAGVETMTIWPSTLKKLATGSGKAKKDEMIAAASRRWPGVTIKHHDQADALCVLAWALTEIGAAS